MFNGVSMPALMCTDPMSEFYVHKTKRSLKVMGCCTQRGNPLFLKTEIGKCHATCLNNPSGKTCFNVFPI